MLFITVSKSVFATSSYPKCPSFTHLQFHHRTRFSGFLVILYEVWLWSLMLIEKNGNEMLLCCLFDASMCNETMAWRRLATLLVYTILCQGFHFQQLSVNWLLSTVLLTTFLICHRTSFIGRVFLTLEWIFVIGVTDNPIYITWNLRTSHVAVVYNICTSFDEIIAIYPYVLIFANIVFNQ